MSIFDKQVWQNMSDYELKALEDYILDMLEANDNDIKDTTDKNLILREKLYQLQLYMIARNN